MSDLRGLGGGGCSVGRSRLSWQDLRGFTQEVWDVICEERPSSGRPLGSATIRERLEERGVEVPDYAMYDVFEDLKGGLIEFGFGGPTNPEVAPDAEVVRKHGGLIITSVDTDLCP
jgi:hypothetical protein